MAARSPAAAPHYLFILFLGPENQWLLMTNIAIENGHLYRVFPFNMVIFHSYVKLLEGNGCEETPMT